MTGFDIAGGVAVVTGAGTSIGRELARAFARRGATVLCAGRRLDRLDETVALITAEGGAAESVRLDVTDPDSVRTAFDDIVARHGRLDLVFANAGSFASVAPIWEADPDLWWQDATVNLRGTMLCARYAVPHLMHAGRGVFLAMDGGGGTSGPNLGGSGYGSSKAAVVRFTEGLARELELAGSPVLAMSMNPGFVRSEMTEALVQTDTGRQWQTWVVDALETGVGSADDDCAKATLELLAIAGAELNGCAFSVETDFAAVDRDRARIARDRLHVLRLTK